MSDKPDQSQTTVRDAAMRTAKAQYVTEDYGRGSKEWRAEVLRLAAECDRLGMPEIASALRMAEWKQT